MKHAGAPQAQADRPNGAVDRIPACRALLVRPTVPASQHGWDRPAASGPARPRPCNAAVIVRMNGHGSGR